MTAPCRSRTRRGSSSSATETLPIALKTMCADDSSLGINTRFSGLGPKRKPASHIGRGLLTSVEECENGQHTTVVFRSLRDVELHENATNVLLDSSFGHEQLVPDPG